ncbi:uracil-DNA glycosylase family protein [Litorilituus lipolyticus]|uniref:Uracil-DNA glycosylase family protein n=1 Tax=Litorilituus lipolyticus TaxID=2491017 RepID=A0A502KQT9_9GAMM|nr:uracil-DNA glycosylase family protein [Litorilituus lipolyticus]TPH14048.1 uracil-DNA glycosylase family protein [Litorilituus lipolyticus]
MNNLFSQIQQCQLCANQLPLGAKPILQFSSESKILIAGQAPGIKTHPQGIPFDDKSGERLRNWLGVKRDEFYNDKLFAIIPMSFCYPGKGKSGDLPPLPLCAKTWRNEVMSSLKHIELTIILGKYAIAWHLQKSISVTELVKQNLNATGLILPSHIVLPHPSPRNNIWLKKNPWFDSQVIPSLQNTVKSIIGVQNTQDKIKI